MSAPTTSSNFISRKLQLVLLRSVILWTMSSSRAVRDIIDHAYKGKRQDDDANIPLSVQPWGSDSDKRRYYLIEGRDAKYIDNFNF